jgi:hypothetical protein
MRLTKSKLRQLIKEEISAIEERLDLGRLAGGAIDGNHLFLLETAERYRAIVEADPRYAETLSAKIKSIHSLIKRISKLRLKLEKG